MKRLLGLLLAATLSALPALAETELLVTVINKRTGEPVTDLQPGEFRVTVDKVQKPVASLEYAPEPIDIMLLVDSSLVGESVAPFSHELIDQLDAKEQMAVVAYHSNADLVQDFTSSQQMLHTAVGEVEYGNSPRLLDALYAAITDGFNTSHFRRVLVLVTSGIDGPSRMKERDVLQVARTNDVSIYPVFFGGYGKSLFQRLAQGSGGAVFSLQEMSRRSQTPPAEQIFEVMRSHYTLRLPGNLPLGENVQVKVTRKGSGNLLISALPLE